MDLFNFNIAFCAFKLVAHICKPNPEPVDLVVNPSSNIVEHLFCGIASPLLEIFMQILI